MPPLRDARFMRWWPYLVGCLFLAYAWVIPDPHAFNNAAVDRSTWALAGLLLLWSGLHPQHGPRLSALCATVGLCAVRITVLAAYPSSLTPGRIATGAVVWTTLAVLITFLTLASEIIDAPTRLFEQ